MWNMRSALLSLFLAVLLTREESLVLAEVVRHGLCMTASL